jgi:YHS domain-containing protein
MDMRIRRYLYLVCLAPFLLACTTSRGLEPVNKTAAGLALKGYDPVAYFTENKTVSGNEHYQHSWNGARWHFASAENRDAFARNPEQYAPQYGGYCAYAVSHGYSADGDPQVWKIVDRKLYLNYNREARQMWEEDIPGNIGKGNRNWPVFLKRKPEHKG